MLQGCGSHPPLHPHQVLQQKVEVVVTVVPGGKGRSASRPLKKPPQPPWQPLGPLAGKPAPDTSIITTRHGSGVTECQATRLP